MFKVNNKDTGTVPMTSFRLFYCELRAYFTPSSSVCIVNFEHVIVGWVMPYGIIPQSDVSFISS